MAEVVLFHSILGLRPAEAAIAARMRAAGHKVTTPDLYDGLRTDSYNEGFGMHDAIGDAELLRRARDAVAALPAETVLAGVSMGGGIAGELWKDRRETAGVLFLHGPAPLAPAPRPGTPVEVHMADPEPFDDEAFIGAWIAEALALPIAFKVFRYAGAGHFFTDATLPDHDAAAAELALGRAVDLLARV
ncbi:MAG: dienelactone hydrolase family protein [Amaricoccus sp.]